MCKKDVGQGWRPEKTPRGRDIELRGEMGLMTETEGEQGKEMQLIEYAACFRYRKKKKSN